MNAMDAVQDTDLLSTRYSGGVQGVSATTTLRNAKASGFVSPSDSEFVVKRFLRYLGNSFVDRLSEFVDSDAVITDNPLASMLQYLVSPFALLCMFMAIILSRTMVFAATRRPTSLPIAYRWTLRSIAIGSILMQMRPLLTALMCASRPTNVPIQVANWLPNTMFTAECPSAGILWDLYRSICIGHFIETFSSVVQGNVPYSETGMTLFEYSVAFFEVQSFNRLSPEILVVSIMSALSHLALHVQGMFNSHRYRLIPSTVFGVAFLAYFAWCIFHGRLFFFPYICVMGYLPQLMISVVVLICGSIYSLACLLAGPSNMQTSTKTFTLDMSEDFYTALAKLGVLALTSVTRATYLTEAASLTTPLGTWIERQEARYTTPPANPYANEVTRVPKSDTGQRQDDEVDRPASGVVVVNRVVAAVQMVQALVSLVLCMVWSRIKRIVPFGQQQRRNQMDKVEQEIVHLRSKIVYACLDDEYQGYSRLVMGDVIPDYDDSVDFDPDDDDGSEYDGYEFESDYTSDEDEVAAAATATTSTTTLRSTTPLSDAARQRLAPHATAAAAASRESSSRSSRTSTLADLYDLLMSTPDALLSLLTPQSQEDAEHAQILSSHLKSQGTLTRSQYHDMHKNDVNVVAQLISERRPEQRSPEDDQVLQSVCVVCQTQPREVVLWPCRCFALCEECRLGLAIKNFKGCVCCRRDVDSFSRIFVP